MKDIFRVSMYSFKGGAGRTVCTVNVAAFLAHKLGANADSRLLLMDLDLDSAGLTVLLGQYDHFKGNRFSTAKLISGELNFQITAEREEFFEKGLVDVSKILGAPEKTIFFLGTEIVGSKSNIAHQDAAGLLLDFFKRCGQNKFNGALLDSASGLQETAIVCHQVSNVVVYCCRLSLQFIYGTGHQLKQFIDDCKKVGEAPSIILLPVAIPPADGMWKEKYNTRMAQLQLNVTQFSSSTSIKLLKNGIGEVQSFKWEESVLRIKPKSSISPDEAMALKAYEAVADEISELLLTNDEVQSQ
jgi:cellulose biosynthesis protein BcsQ